MLQSIMETLTTGDGLKLHLQRWPAAVATGAADGEAHGKVHGEAHGKVHGTVQIVHGLGEHIGRYAALAVALNAAGWQVAGHDQRGHGRSEGPRGSIPGKHTLLADLSAVVDHLRGPGRHVLLGHSMGGLIAARFVAESLLKGAARWARDVDGLVLSSPALDIGLGPLNRLLLAMMLRLAPNLRMGNGLKAKWISRDPEVVRRYLADPLVHTRITPRLTRFMVEEGRWVSHRAARWRTPTLLLWAGADRCVAPAGSAAFAAAAPPTVLAAQCFDGLYHELFNEPEQAQVIRRLTAWLARF